MSTMNIQDFVTPKAIAAYWQERQQYEKPYLGEALFPNDKQLGLDLSWFKGVRKSPAPLSLSAFDADVLTRSRGKFERLSTEMPFFKNSKRIDEKLRQQINTFISNNNSRALEIMFNHLFEDTIDLLRDAALGREVMRWQILTTGSLALVENGQKYEYDYDVPTSHKKVPSVKWDVKATADPVADIISWKNIIANETGNPPTEMYLNTVTLDTMAKTDAIQKGIFARYSNIFTEPTPNEVKAYISQRLDGLQIIVYDKGWDKNGTFTKFIPDGTVILTPNAKLGNTVFGTTPEESDLMSGANANVMITDTGVAITTWKIEDPVTVETKVSQIVLPTFERANEVIIASVLS